MEKLTCSLCNGDGCEHCKGAGYYESQNLAECIHDLYAKNKALKVRIEKLEDDNRKFAILIATYEIGPDYHED